MTYKVISHRVPEACKQAQEQPVEAEGRVNCLCSTWSDSITNRNALFIIATSSLDRPCGLKEMCYVNKEQAFSSLPHV